MSPALPNIVWIVTTQWRAQATGYAGDPNAHTPCLDELAGRALSYTQAVTPHPFGPFARAALLTGILSPENGVRSYFDPLPKTSRTIAHDMAALGYRTAFFGKWHLGKRDPKAPLVGDVHARMAVAEDERGGFEFWEGFESGFLLNNPWLHGTRLPEPTRFEGYQSDVVCERAGRWLQETSPQAGPVRPRSEARSHAPSFCVVSLEAPHPPYDAPAGEISPRDPSSLILPRNVPKEDAVETKARRELAGYYAHIEATDRAIGRLVAQAGADALIVFTSVHGDMHGSHGVFRKGWPFEESVRVPLLIATPHGKGERRDDAISLVDLPNLTKHFAATGELKRCDGSRAHLSMPSVVSLPHQCDRAWTGWRSKNAKEVFDATGALWMKFDLQADPYEERNLA
jgi:arylsulfatase A-like enzyme